MLPASACFVLVCSRCCWSARNIPKLLQVHVEVSISLCWQIALLKDIAVKSASTLMANTLLCWLLQVHSSCDVSKQHTTHCNSCLYVSSAFEIPQQTRVCTELPTSKLDMKGESYYFSRWTTQPWGLGSWAAHNAQSQGLPSTGVSFVPKKVNTTTHFRHRNTSLRASPRVSLLVEAAA